MIKASQNDFEEFGVDQSTLDEMKQVRDRLAASPAIAPSLNSWQHRAATPLLCLSSMSLSFCQKYFPVVYAALDGGAMQPGLRGDGRPEAGLSSRLVSQVGGALSIWVTFYSPCSAAQPRQAKPIAAQPGLVASCDGCLLLAQLDSTHVS